jgi:pimeloyl-ACP methyl ester carboxylesterase
MVAYALMLMPFAELSGLNLYYEEHGDGPPILLIAGIPAIADDWEPLSLRLAEEGRRVIAYDNRGSGQSSVMPGPYTTAQMAGDAVALLDHLGLERADAFGMSLGGMIAQELAIGYPDRVRRLVLGCTHAGIAHAAHAAKAASRAFALSTDDWALRMRTLAPFAFAQDVDPSWLQSFIDKKARDVQDPIGYRAQIEAVFAHDTASRLALIRAPTLILTGDDDQVIPGESSQLLVERIPNATLRIVRGTGHLFFAERPGETIEILAGFLGRDANRVPGQPVDAH